MDYRARQPKLPHVVLRSVNECLLVGTTHGKHRKTGLLNAIREQRAVYSCRAVKTSNNRADLMAAIICSCFRNSRLRAETNSKDVTSGHDAR